MVCCKLLIIELDSELIVKHQYVMLLCCLSLGLYAHFTNTMLILKE